MFDWHRFKCSICINSFIISYIHTYIQCALIIFTTLSLCLNLPRSSSQWPSNFMSLTVFNKPLSPMCSSNMANCPYSWVWVHPLEHDLDLPGATLLKKNLTLLLVSINWQLLSLESVLMGLSLIHAWVLTDLILCQSCVGNHRCCEPLIAVVLSFLEDTFVPKSFLNSSSYDISVPFSMMVSEL